MAHHEIQRASRVIFLIALTVTSVLPLPAQRATIRADVDLVVVPTSVKDADGHLVYDLKQEDFSIFEDGRRQQITQFSIDPAPLSAVVLIDTGIGGTALRRFSAAITALSYSFIPIDEVEAYRYQKYVAKLSDFSSDQDKFEKDLAFIQKYP